MHYHNTFNKKNLQLPIGLILLLVLFSGVLYLFILIDEVLWQKEELMDNKVFNFFSTYTINPHLTSFMKGVTYFASANFSQVTIWYLKNLKRIQFTIKTDVLKWIIMQSYLKR
ncbi:MAG: hypothetical protein ABIN97_15855 [Ginsengibacter sp.]